MTETLENYLKAVLVLSGIEREKLASMGELSSYLNLSPGTVTTMVKRFSRDGWMNYYPRKGCSLTKNGEITAINILKRHRLIEYFLVEILGMVAEDVHKEAESLEHSMSDNVIDRLDHFLGFPEKDPHGKPIIRNTV